MKIIIATNNAHKVGEFERILRPLGIEAVSMNEAGINADPDENSDSFEGNAYIKAKAVYDITGEITVADDSGLEVYALDNAPGVYSARYGGEGLNDKQRYEKLLNELKDITESERGARFVCAVSLITKSGKNYTFTGVCEGKIGYEPLGENGFGYDPVFMVGEDSFSVLSPEKKDEISHRGIALRKMAEEIKKLI